MKKTKLSVCTAILVLLLAMTMANLSGCSNEQADNGMDTKQNETENSDSDITETEIETTIETETKPETESETEAEKVRPEIKELLDEYELAMYEYCGMFDSEGNIVGGLANYALVMDKLTSVQIKMDKIGELNPTDEEIEYYQEIAERVSKRMKEAGLDG